MKRARRTELFRIRRALCAEYHAFGEVLMDDVTTDEKGRIIDTPDGEVDDAFNKVSDAINCINRELGIPENC